MHSIPNITYDRRRSGIRKDPVGARERAREQQLTEWTRCKENKTMESMQPCKPNACCEKQSTIFTLPTISDKGATWLPLGSAHPQGSRGLLEKGVKWNDSMARVIGCSGGRKGSHNIIISMMLTGCHRAKDQTSWPCCRSSRAHGGYVPDQACCSGVAGNKRLPAASYTTFKYDNLLNDDIKKTYK